MRRREELAAGGEPEWLTWFKGVLNDAGYDVTAPRGGGQAKLAKDTGIAQSTISRIIDGQVPGYENQLILSRHLGLAVADFLVRTGKATEDDFPHTGSETGQTPVSSGKPLTPEEVAAYAGVPEGDRAWFAMMVRRVRKNDVGDDGSAAGGVAAEG